MFSVNNLLRILSLPIEMIGIARKLIRFVALIITPITLVLLAFSFTLSWILFQCWWYTKPPTSSQFGEKLDTSLIHWKDWGRCMLEASFDTLTGLLAIIFTAVFFQPETTDQLLNQLDQQPLFFWCFFWGLTMIPFAIRLRKEYRNEADSPSVVDR